MLPHRLIRAAMIKRCFKSRDHDLLFRAFVVFVRPLLVYCSSVWNPSYYCDVDKNESVQRRFTKNIGTLSSLHTLNVWMYCMHVGSLELRRLKCDLTMMFRIIHGYCALDRSSFFTLHNSCTRGNKFKLRKQFSRVNCRHFSFANRCIDAWNSLSDDVVCAPSVPVFKGRLVCFCWVTMVLPIRFSV